MNEPTQTEFATLGQPPTDDTREVCGADLADALAEIKAADGIVTVMETVRGRNGVWRLRIRWQHPQPK